jgi:hypothetical protein
LKTAHGPQHVFGLPSDGMVPFADSIIPGSESVKIVGKLTSILVVVAHICALYQGVDHAEPVLIAADKIAMFGAHLKVSLWLCTC